MRELIKKEAINMNLANAKLLFSRIMDRISDKKHENHSVNQGERDI